MRDREDVDVPLHRRALHRASRLDLAAHGDLNRRKGKRPARRGFSFSGQEPILIAMRHVDIGSLSPSREMQAPIQTEPGTLAAIDPLIDARYDEFVAGCERAGAYHAGAWARILARTYRARPHYLASSAPDGALEAVLPLMTSRGVVSGTRLRS